VITLTIKQHTPGYLRGTVAGNSFVWLALGAALREATKAALAYMVGQTPRHSNKAAESLKMVIRGVPPTGREGRVTSNLDYYTNIVHGRSPGRPPPPVAAIAAWLGDKGLDPGAAYAVSRNIGLYGIPSGAARSSPPIPTHANEQAVRDLAPAIEAMFYNELMRRIR
jgi:hypothetical protein